MATLRAWVNVYDPTGTTRLGGGPITPESISQTRVLDGAGTFSLSVPRTSKRAIDLLINRRVVEIVYEDPYTRALNNLTRGIIFSTSDSDSGGRLTMTVDGPDAMQLLRDKSTLLARIYTLQNTDTMLAALAAIAGWTTSGSLTGQTVARFDGENVLKSMQATLERTGYHMRLSTSSANQVQIGTFGADSGYLAWHVEGNVSQAPPSLFSRQNKLIPVETLQIETEGSDVVNWILPIGGGEGEAALTLEKSTRTTPYAIQTTTGPDGRTLYYLSDSTSIATYGTIQKVGTFKDINPITNTDADIVNAANALYDATVAYLIRHKDPLTTYSMTLRGRVGILQPGDKIRVVYKGVVYREGVPVAYRDIDQMFWMLEVTDNIGVSGFSSQVRIASVDRYELDSMDVIIGALDDLQIDNLKIQPYPNTRSFVWPRDVAPSFHGNIPVRFTDACLKLLRLQVRITTSPYRITAQQASASGDHRHIMFVNLGGDFGPSGTYKTMNASDSTGSTSGYSVRMETNAPDNLYTVGGSGTHTHPLVYGITDDTLYPSGISIYVDGIDRTAALGGPWNPGTGSPITIDLNEALMTGYINNAAGGLRQEHTISFRCTSGRGHIEAVVEIYELVQALKV